MKQIIFVTGNADKIKTATRACEEFGVSIVPMQADVAEIQHEDPAAIALDKAAKAFATIGKPLVISDDSWAIAALGGFPGSYMHSVNEWFTPQDFLRLMHNVADRQITLTQRVVYIDAQQQKLFQRSTQGVVLTEARGESRHPSHAVISLDASGKSLAENLAAGGAISASAMQVWHDFASWFTKQ